VRIIFANNDISLCIFNLVVDNLLHFVLIFEFTVIYLLYMYLHRKLKVILEGEKFDPKKPKEIIFFIYSTYMC